MSSKSSCKTYNVNDVLSQLQDIASDESGVEGDAPFQSSEEEVEVTTDESSSSSDT